MNAAELYAGGQWTLANLDLCLPRKKQWRVWLFGVREAIAVETDAELPHLATCAAMAAVGRTCPRLTLRAVRVDLLTASGHVLESWT